MKEKLLELVEKLREAGQREHGPCACCGERIEDGDFFDRDGGGQALLPVLLRYD